MRVIRKKLDAIMFLSVKLIGFEHKKLVRVKNNCGIFKINLAKVTERALFSTFAKCPLLSVIVLPPLAILFQLRYNPQLPSNLVQCPESF